MVAAVPALRLGRAWIDDAEAVTVRANVAADVGLSGGGWLAAWVSKAWEWGGSRWVGRGSGGQRWVSRASSRRGVLVSRARGRQAVGRTVSSAKQARFVLPWHAALDGMRSPKQATVEPAPGVGGSLRTRTRRRSGRAEQAWGLWLGG
ncbi:hypothetical protein GCM10009554_76680 [Kribbella koreensis]|uniref:Uncharacterized protein n=1 Tax=Kribbella koreensis TaxID=57909 RepID=A0ABN1RP59_9ACTN